MISIERWALLGYFLAYFLLAFVLRSWVVWHRTGVNPYALPKSDDAYGLVTSGFRWLIVIVTLYLTAQAIWPGVTLYLAELEWLQVPALRYLGWVGLTVSLVWVLVAQAQMGSSWRIGIDNHNPTALVTTGLFQFSRNPIFLAMRVNLLGLFLIQPNAITLAAWLVGDVLMQFQVRLEESYLASCHGERYFDYRSRVRRWL